MDAKKNQNDKKPKLLLQSEAAAALRCSVATIKRLRLARKLGYYTGRPVLISENDLELYVASVKVIRVRMPGQAVKYETVPADTKPRPFKLLTVHEIARDSRRTAATIRRWLRVGKVPYIPGKSKRIDATDFNDFVLRTHRSAPEPIPEPGTIEFLHYQAKERGKVVAEIREKVRVARLRRRMPANRRKPRT